MNPHAAELAWRDRNRAQHQPADHVGLLRFPAACHAVGRRGQPAARLGGSDLAPEESTFSDSRRNRTEEDDEQWPVNVHGLYVDADETVWIGGNGSGDHVILNFTADGDFIRQIGRRQMTEGSLSEQYLGSPANISVDGDTVLVADGYTNTCVIEFSGTNLALRNCGALMAPSHALARARATSTSP